VLRRYEYEDGLPDFLKQWTYSLICVNTKFCKQKFDPLSQFTGFLVYLHFLSLRFGALSISVL
jgi:hypothetical protein